jgi:hypothetical protein
MFAQSFSWAMWRLVPALGSSQSIPNHHCKIDISDFRVFFPFWIIWGNSARLAHTRGVVWSIRYGISQFTHTTNWVYTLTPSMIFYPLAPLSLYNIRCWWASPFSSVHKSWSDCGDHSVLTKYLFASNILPRRHSTVTGDGWSLRKERDHATISDPLSVPCRWSEKRWHMTVPCRWSYVNFVLQRCPIMETWHMGDSTMWSGSLNSNSTDTNSHLWTTTQKFGLKNQRQTQTSRTANKMKPACQKLVLLIG